MKPERHPLGFQYCKSGLLGGGHDELSGEDVGAEGFPPALLKFQRQLGVPAVQFTDEGEAYRRMVNDGHPVLGAPAWLWLTRLP